MERTRLNAIGSGANTCRVALAGTCLLLLGACSVTLVQPYDEQLFADTGGIFRKASAMIDAGIAASPRTDEERERVAQPGEHPGHLSRFTGDYASLGIEADALILRALAGSRETGPLGGKIQASIEQLIEQNIPSLCEQLEAELGLSTSSLTVKNYIDLKCIFVRWRAQHADAELTQGTQILKKTNWELRRTAVFRAVLAIQSAESSKPH